MEAAKLKTTIEEEFEKFCNGCRHHNLCIEYKFVFDANNRIEDKKPVLTCENLEECTWLYQCLKERQNG